MRIKAGSLLCVIFSYFILIYHILDGATEIWEQDLAFAWFKETLLNLNIKDSTFFDKILTGYKEILETMNQYYEKEYLPLKELKEFIIKIEYIQNQLFLKS